MKKILLINPPRTYYTGSKGVRIGLPLGLMYIAAWLEKNGYAPKILDCLIHPDSMIITQEGKTTHGITDEKIIEILKQEKPDIVGITSPFTAQIDNTIKLVNLIKQFDSRIITVVGGPHVSVRGKILLEENKNIDLGVRGEGEYVFLQIIKNLERGESLAGIKSIFYRDQGGQVVENEFGGPVNNLDDLPYPAYHLIDLKTYFDLLDRGLATRPSKQKRSISLITSRGCPYNCVFCSIHLHMGKAWRAHSAEYVINHIDYVINKYGIKHISFEDDNFTLDIKRAKKILQSIIEKNIKITWDTPNGVRADRLDEELAGLMKKSGCQELIFGVESGDQNVLNTIIDKNLDLNAVISAAAICKKFKIKAQAFFVIGFPGEKIEAIRKSMDFALTLRKKYGVRSGFLIATPLVGTRLYEICKKNGYLVQEPDPRSLSMATQIWGRGLIKTDDFTPEKLKELAFELDKKMTRLDLMAKIKNPLAWFGIFRFLFSHPLKSGRYLARKVF